MGTVNVPSVLEKSSSASLVVPSVLDQAIPPPPSFSDNTEPVKMTVKINPKYANMIVNNSVAEQKKSDCTEHMEDSSYSHDSPRPEAKSEVMRRETAKAASAEAPSREIKINEKYLGLTPNPVQTSMGTLRMTSEKILDFVPNQSPVVNEETAQQQPSPPESRSSLIRINPKYKGLLTQNTENIAAKEDSTAQNQEKSSSPPAQPAPAPPMIKINPKYANLPGLPPLARQMMGINPETQNKSPMFSELTVAQLMETMVPKKLNFILPKGSTGVNSPKLGGGLLGGAESSVENGLSSLPLTVLEKTNEERSVSLHLPEVAPAIQTSCATTPSTTTSHRLPGQVAHLPFTITSNHLPLTTSLLTIPSSSTSSSTSTASQPSNILLPATLANNSIDEMEDEHISDESSNPEQVNKNVLRCRSYRNRKKNLLANQEEEVHLLETFNLTLRSKHDYLDSSIKRLQSYYLDMIRHNKYKCCGQNEKKSSSNE